MKRITLRCDDTMHAALMALAKAQRRSLHGELLVCIDEGIRREQMLLNHKPDIRGRLIEKEASQANS